ncbi:unnamed protein product [Mesocestoides corti]|uniref:Band 3 cytoplasmic domain-containing protein n=2 Tax=Mesocestoides corti TaxID=53468 RepID=A0A0R3UB00_MESCO|nr:unnamed protein product [Mesocestoides corti]
MTDFVCVLEARAIHLDFHKATKRCSLSTSFDGLWTTNCLHAGRKRPTLQLCASQLSYSLDTFKYITMPTISEQRQGKNAYNSTFPRVSDVSSWIKFEEEVEESADRWSKPHVAIQPLMSVFEVRNCLAKAVMLLDLEATSLEQVAERRRTSRNLRCCSKKTSAVSPSKISCLRFGVVEIMQRLHCTPPIGIVESASFFIRITQHVPFLVPRLCREFACTASSFFPSYFASATA